MSSDNSGFGQRSFYHRVPRALRLSTISNASPTPGQHTWPPFFDSRTSEDRMPVFSSLLSSFSSATNQSHSVISFSNFLLSTPTWFTTTQRKKGAYAMYREDAQ